MPPTNEAQPGQVNLTAIREAAKRIQSSIYETPFVYSETLSGLAGNSIFLKLESLQMTGSFKERGALNRILLLSAEEQRNGDRKSVV